MRIVVKTITLSAVVTFGLGASGVLAHEHGEKSGHSHERAEVHGGVATMSKEFHVETVFMPDQVRLYLYDGEQNPMHVQNAKGVLVSATGVVDFREQGRGTTTLKFVRAVPGGYACPMCSGQESSKPGKCAKCGMKLVKKDVPEGTLWSCPMHPDENGKGPGRCGDCGMKYTPQDYLVAPVDFKGVKPGDARVTFNLNNLPGASEKTLRFTEKYTPAGRHDDDGHEDHDHEGHEHGDHDHGDHDH